MKRKRTKGLLTAGKQNLTTAASWAQASFDNFCRLERAEGREPEPPTERPEWLNVTEREDGEPEIAIYGMITPYPWMDGEKSAADIYTELQEIDADRIHVRINSPGGSIFEAVTMFNLLKEKNAEIVVHIDGIAGSSAGWLAMVGDEVIAGEGTRLMIHRASVCMCGDAEELRKEADVLESLEDSILTIFEKRTDMESDELREMMNAETYLTAEEAVEHGFADRVAGAESTPEKETNLGARPVPGNSKSDPDAGDDAEKKIARLKLLQMRQDLHERQIEI